MIKEHIIMTVERLKEILKDMPDNRSVYIAKYNSGSIFLWGLERCVNAEHQENENELWFSAPYLRRVS